MAFSIHQTGLPERFQWVPQTDQPGSQTSAGSVADAQFFDQFSTMQSTLQQIGDRVGMAVQLHLVECGDVRQRGTVPTPAPKQSHGVCESDTVIQLREANHIATTAAAVAVKQVLAGIHQKARPVIGMQGTQAHQLAAGRPSGWLPSLSLQVIEQWDLLLE